MFAEKRLHLPPLPFVQHLLERFPWGAVAHIHHPAATVAKALDDMQHNVVVLVCVHSDRGTASLAPRKGTTGNPMYIRCTGQPVYGSVCNGNDNGFVLMIEGSQIDWACHNNDSLYLMAEMADFEDMLNAVLDFAERDGQTLVIVTADHETGGLTLKNGSIEEGVNCPSWSTGGHTGVMVPVFSYGPGADLFSGVMQNTDFYGKLMMLMGVKRN